jgi:transposase
MPANYVKPYVKRGKTDAADAEAICEAVRRPTMRFVKIKTEEQQAILSIHRTRDLAVRQRTQMANMIRSLLREFGHILQTGIDAVTAFSKRHLDGDQPDMIICKKYLVRMLKGRTRFWHDPLFRSL